MSDQSEQPVGRCSIDLLNDCIPMFEALKDPMRQQIVVHLLQHGPQTVGEISQASPLSRTTVSHHVKLLEQAGLLSITKVATRRICQVRSDEALGLLEGLVAALESDIQTFERERGQEPPARRCPSEAVRP